MLNGIDISSWQSDLDLSKVKVDFVIVKATGGKGYINPSCDKHIQQAIKLEIPFGFYHYAHEKGLEGTAIQEAEYFVKHSKGYFGKGFPILDFESSNKHDVKWALDFLNRVYKLTGVKPLFYTYTSVVNNYDFSPIYKSDYGLWIANYGTDSKINGFQKPNPPHSNGFPQTIMFQYSSNTFIAGYNNRLDANVFYGDKKAWEAYVKGSKVGTPVKKDPPKETKPVTPTKPKESGKIKMKKIVTTSPVYLRTKPSRNATAITGKPLPVGTTIEFNNVIVAQGYIWGEQPRHDGSKGYIALGEFKEVYGKVSNK